MAATMARSGLAAWRESALEDVLQARTLGSLWLWLLAVTCGCAAVYGGVFGSWHGPRLALFVAVKFPLVLLGTSGLTLPFNWTLAVATRAPLTFRQVAVLTFLTLALASVIVASLAPVAWVFVRSAPPPGDAARTAHNLLYLMHTAIVGGAGFASVALLRGALARRGETGARAARAIRVWVVTFALVGGQVAWALRPFVGSVYYPVEFLRDDALDGNVYEFIVTDILPHLTGRTPHKEAVP
ncbi:MAG TPA: hypothetical protein VFQ51_02205 [Vicinamibacteria bacterium]|nr:hypothetical protein [Vicinamibacteria bacterium]